MARVTRRAGLESPGLQFESGTSGHRRTEAALAVTGGEAGSP